MSTDPTDREHNAEVVPLRAVDAHTETVFDEDATPRSAYVDLTSGDAKRKPIIPEHWRTRENARRHVGLAVVRYAHWSAYHGVRLPAYLARSVAFAAWGVFVTGGRLIAWWHIPGTSAMEHDAAKRGDIDDHLRLHKQGRQTRSARATILGLCLAGLLAAVLLTVRYAPVLFIPAAAVAFAALALAGRPKGSTITTRAQNPAQVQPPTPDVITRSLGSLGIAQIKAALRNGDPIGFPSPVREDGPAGGSRPTCPTASPPR